MCDLFIIAKDHFNKGLGMDRPHWRCKYSHDHGLSGGVRLLGHVRIHLASALNHQEKDEDMI